MYGIYYDYEGYNIKLEAICPTIIECKRLLAQEAKRFNLLYKELLGIGDYSIVEISLNGWIRPLKKVFPE